MCNKLSRGKTPTEKSALLEKLSAYLKCNNVAGTIDYTGNYTEEHCIEKEIRIALYQIMLNSIKKSKGITNNAKVDIAKKAIERVIMEATTISRTE